MTVLLVTSKIQFGTPRGALKAKQGSIMGKSGGLPHSLAISRHIAIDDTSITIGRFVEHHV